MAERTRSCPCTVINFAKKTGDYSVLSHADMCILALTYALSKEEEDKAKVSSSLLRLAGVI